MISRFLPLLALTVALLFASGCKSSTGPGDSNQIPLIPLAVGNEWKYNEMNLDSSGAVMTMMSDTARIVADDMIDGEEWFVEHGPNPEGEITYLINRNDGLWRFHPQWGDQMARYLHYPIALNDDNNVGNEVFNIDSASHTVSFHTKINALHKSVTVPAGSYDCIEVEQEYRGDASLGANCGATRVLEYYSPGVGLIQADWYGTTSNGTPFVFYRRSLAALHLP